MCGSMVDIQCAMADIGRGKKMKEETTGRKYYVRVCVKVAIIIQQLAVLYNFYCYLLYLYNRQQMNKHKHQVTQYGTQLLRSSGT